MRVVQNLEERVSVPVRVNGDLYRRIARLAANDRRNIKQQIELLLEKALLEQPRLAQST